MLTLISFFAMLGTFCLGLVLVAVAMVGFAFAGAALGGAVSMGFLSGREDPGIGKGAFWGCLLGFFWTLYCLHTSEGLWATLMAVIGTLVVMLVVAWIVAMFFPAAPAAYDPDAPDYPGRFDAED
jgi:hypothetical protein